MEFWSWIELYHLQLVRSINSGNMILALTIDPHSTDLSLNPTSIGTSDNFNVTVTVHNTGLVDGKEVVQVWRAQTIGYS